MFLGLSEFNVYINLLYVSSPELHMEFSCKLLNWLNWLTILFHFIFNLPYLSILKGGGGPMGIFL